MPTKINIKGKIRFNGQEYDSVESMPPEVRQEFEKVIAGIRNPGAGQVVIRNPGKVIFNGREYSSLEAMPEDVRRQYQQILGALDKDADGIPDMLAGGQPGSVPPAQADSTFMESSPLIPQVTPRQSPPSLRTALVVLVALGAALLLLALALAILR